MGFLLNQRSNITGPHIVPTHWWSLSPFMALWLIIGPIFRPDIWGYFIRIYIYINYP